MGIIKLAQPGIYSLAVWLREHVVRFSAVVHVVPHKSRPGSTSTATQPDRRSAMRAERLFAQAVQESSNLEFDWLWCAANMTCVA